MIELRVLGPPRIGESGERPIASIVRHSSRFALLAYLAAARPRGAQRRDRLLAIFWPDADGARARAALNQALYFLRTRLGEDAFLDRGDDLVALDPRRIWCDVVAFEQALASGRPADALALYSGDLLDGFFIRGAPDFERWVDEERSRLRERASEGAWMLARERAAAGDAIDAERWARRAADFLPADEAVIRRLMTFLHTLGDRAAAIRAYDAFVRRLHQEFELAPSPETRSLAESIATPRVSQATPHETIDRPAGAEASPTEADADPPRVTASTPGHRGSRQAPVRWIVAATLVAIAGVAATWIWTRGSPPRSRGEWVALLDVNRSPPLAAGIRGSTIALSTTGDLAYVSRAATGFQLSLKRRGRAEAEPVPRTSGAEMPFFSPDGGWLGFVRQGMIQLLSLSTGLAQNVCPVDLGLSGIAWGDDDMLVFADAAGLWRVPARGGEPVLIARTDSASGISIRWPELLPGNRAAVVTLVSPTRSELATVSLATGAIRSLGIAGTDPQFVAPEHLLFARRDGTVFVTAFDPLALRVTGRVTQLVDRVHVGIAGAAKLAVTREALAYIPLPSPNRLVIVDSAGNERPVPGPARAFRSPRFLRDGATIATAIDEPADERSDIWLVDVASGDMRRITYDSASVDPTIAHAGDARMAYATMRSGRRNGFEIRLTTTASGASTTLVPAWRQQMPRDFTPDGRSLVFQRRAPDTGFDIWLLPLTGESKPVPYLAGPANERGASIAPGGRLMAWVSDESGRDEVYVGGFPDPGEPVRVSVNGGREPRWHPDGDRLFYRAPEGFSAVDLLDGALAATGAHTVLFDDSPYDRYAHGLAYDVHPAGDRFVMIRSPATHPDVLVRFDWLAMLSPR